ncbi:hypothetical protein MUU72_31260 [Streptomyces sp. RS10V-4]|uniref:hypothetical protein n=1 Tax=Streptomyces rhizoryzae TaxID=2932493 RepID=UPI002005DEF0|nr:hypothetical protein [Streptomyces rhizoryzae]MCK7627521.1 hypothetical protein [Streptomyces rhizoryzae]
MAEAGTVEEDDLTVHELRDGKPLCGEAGMVHEWLRAVNCGKCLTARSEKAPRRRERPWRNPAVEDLPPRDS